jgi:hypothetical protein
MKLCRTIKMCGGLIIGCATTAFAGPLGTAFTFQGRLDEGGVPASGVYDFQFRLYDADAGSPVGSPVTIDDWPVDEGYFTVWPDFGDVFNGEERWLEIAVRPGASGGGYTTLSPRQKVTPAPYALALPGLYTVPTAGTPNVIGGYHDNLVDPNAVGATIAGGGGESNRHRVYDSWCTIGGGWSNSVGSNDGNPESAYASSVAGGKDNSASGLWSFVGGGISNLASGQSAVVGGGYDNTASGTSQSTVAGGYTNIASGDYSAVSGGRANTASGRASTVPGGWDNLASGQYSLAAGRRAQAGHDGAFVWADASDPNTSFTSTDTNQFLIRATGGVGIGTHSPETQLHVHSGSAAEDHEVLRLESDSTVGAGLTLASTATNGRIWKILSFTNAGPGYEGSLSFSDATSGFSQHRLFISPTGNLGIGTTTPTNKLDVEGAAAIGATYSGTNAAPTNGLIVEGDVGIGTLTPERALHVNDLSGVLIGTSDTAGGYTALSLSLSAVSNGSASIQAIQSAGQWWGNLRLNPSGGNVGIGTTSPTAKLHIGGTAGTDGLKFPDGTLQTTASRGILAVALNINPPSLDPGVAGTMSFGPVTGAAIGDAVVANPGADFPGGYVIAFVRVSAANELTIGFFNGSDAVQNPPSSTWAIRIIK